MAMDIHSYMIQLHVYRQREGNTEYLVMQRADDEPVYPGLWQVVTGTMEEGERAAQAALRELQEETGLAPLSTVVLPYVASFYNLKTDAVNMVPVFASEVSPDAVVRLSHEHKDCKWVLYDEAIAMLPL